MEDSFKEKRLLTTKEAMLYLNVKDIRTFRGRYITPGHLSNVGSENNARFDIKQIDDLIDRQVIQKKRIPA